MNCLIAELKKFKLVKGKLFFERIDDFGLPIKKLGRRPPLTDLNRLTLMTGIKHPHLKHKGDDTLRHKALHEQFLSVGSLILTNELN